MKSLFGFFIDRPLLVNLLMITVVLGGLFSIRTAGVQGSSVVEFGIFTITTVRAGASPEKMELSVTVPLEEEILEVENIKRVISNSMEGLSIIQVNADTKASPEQLVEIEADIQKAIDRAVGRLPNDILEKPALHAMTSTDRTILKLMVTGTASEEVLRRVARNLQSQLREIRDVSDVVRSGYRDREVRVLLDPEKMSRFAISHEEIASAIRSRNVTETGGSLESFVGEQDVVAIGEFQHPKEVESVIVRAFDNGDYLRLRDIAEIVLDYEDSQKEMYIDGQAGIALDIKPKSRVDEFTLMPQLRGVVEAMEPTLPANVSIRVVDDGTDITRTVMSSLLNNAAIGACLIVAILLLFFPWRAMIWVVAGMPIAILFGVICMQFFNIAISASAMVAMIMMLGLLVDDAIVVSERIFYHFERGAAPQGAALMGITDVAQPVFTGALTTIIAMLPLLLVEGLDSKFLWVIPAVILLMVLGSLFECLFLLPSHVADSLKRGRREERKALWFARVEEVYRKLLGFYLARPWRTACVAVLVVSIAVVAVLRFSNFEPYPDVDTNKVVVLAELPTGATRQDTYEALAEVERRLHNIEHNEYVRLSYISVGDKETGRLDYLIEGRQNSWGTLFIELVPFNHRDVTALEIAKQLRAATADMAEFSSFSVQPLIDQPPSGPPVELQVILDSDDREVIAESIFQFLNEHPAVTESWSNYSPGKSLIELKIRHEKLADYGLKVSDITRALQLAYDGFLVEELQTREELIRYRLQFQDRYRNDISALRSLTVTSAQGEVVPIRNIADFEISQGRFSILHYAGLRAETLFAEIDREQISPAGINREIATYIEEQGFYKQYPGLRFRFGGELETQAESADLMGTGLVLVFTGIFFVMVILFNSLSLPITTLLLVPVSFIMVLLVFVVHDLTVSVAAMVGLLGLVGVLVNGALVMIDLIRRLHAERGGETSWFPREVIIDGAVMRLRPLLITAITTLVGLGPAAYGVAGTHPATAALLMVMFWGVAVGSIVTLFTLPLLLVIESRIKSRIAGDKGGEGSQAASA